MARQLPNILTGVRIALVPALVLALLLKTGSGDVLAAIVFCAASFTDGLDGYLARRNDIVSDFGKLMDPIADKLLIISSMIVLVSLGRLAAWVAMVIIAREFAVTVLRAAVGSRQGVVISASQFGKLKTLFQIAMVLVLILDHGAHPAHAQHYPVWVHLIVYVTVAVTIASGTEYFVAAARGFGAGGRDEEGGSGGSVQPGPPAGVAH
ncbi:MAG TPA: CDP-diacylglycerol--glycerol-3-phosphate 3-phosphatidyltransferase [Solirubrobacteraceae bacterium]|nr:CDP-diacylglycerol--glycerol-3-phosphate 3-phosphatidyltransferase [Solirubrobacteraceae bacterium]